MQKKFSGTLSRDMVKAWVYNTVYDAILSRLSVNHNWSDETKFFLTIVFEKILDKYMDKLNAFADNDMRKEMYEEFREIYVIDKITDEKIHRHRLFATSTGSQSRSNWEEGRKYFAEKYGEKEVTQTTIQESMLKYVYNDLLTQEMNQQTKVILRHLIEHAIKKV